MTDADVVVETSGERSDSERIMSLDDDLVLNISSLGEFRTAKTVKQSKFRRGRKV